MTSYPSRRYILSVVSGALLVAAVRPTLAGGFRSHGGCFIAPEQLAGITFYNAPPQEQTKNHEIISGSGKHDFDQALGRVLANLSGEFEVVPGFGYYDDSASKNALACDDNLVSGTRGTVLFGLGLLNDLLKQLDGDIAVLAVCAHEFAHIHQYKIGIMPRLDKDLPEYCKELYADFFCGLFSWSVPERAAADRRARSRAGVGEAWLLRFQLARQPRNSKNAG